MSCDLEVTNERARCWEKVSSYITMLIINIMDFFFLFTVGDYFSSKEKT